METKPRRKLLAISVVIIALTLFVASCGPTLLAVPEWKVGTGYGVPRPSLYFTPEDSEGIDPTFVVDICNDGDEPKDDAEGVTVEVTVRKGGTYVAGLTYNPYVGDIGDGDCLPFTCTILTNAAWDAAGSGAEIKVKITITNEDIWPIHNENKITHYTLVKNGGNVALSYEGNSIIENFINLIRIRLQELLTIGTTGLI